MVDIVPMIPAALFAILAITRIGAIHAVVFGGFAPASLAQRINASKPRVIMTASCGIEGAKKPAAYQPLIEEALQKSKFQPPRVMIWQREQLKWEIGADAKKNVDWQKMVAQAKSKGLKGEVVPVKSNDGLYIIYTSGQFSHFRLSQSKNQDPLDPQSWFHWSNALRTFGKAFVDQSQAIQKSTQARD